MAERIIVQSAEDYYAEKRSDLKLFFWIIAFLLILIGISYMVRRTYPEYFMQGLSTFLAGVALLALLIFLKVRRR